MNHFYDGDPYEKGRQDFEAGLSRDSNPFDASQYGTTFWEAWFDGWDDARDDRLKMNQSEK